MFTDTRNKNRMGGHMNNRQQNLPSHRRDILTGTPIQSGSEVRHMFSGDTDNHSIPIRLHTRQMVQPDIKSCGTSSTSLGQLDWSPEFERYLFDGTQVREQDSWHNWWTIPYIVDRLYARCVQPGPNNHIPKGSWTEDELTAVLAHLRGKPLTIKTSPYWLEKCRKRITRYVRKVFLPYDDREQD
jgi:hypothetical protein